MHDRHRTLHRFAVAGRRFLHTSILGQIGLIVLFWMAGELAVRVTGLPIPGGVAGLFLVLALLLSGRLRLVSMQRGAKWFIAELLLFFIPAVLAVLDHREFAGLLGLKILAVILAGTAAVMLATALAVDFGYRFLMRERKAHAHAAE